MQFSMPSQLRSISRFSSKPMHLSIRDKRLRPSWFAVTLFFLLYAFIACASVVSGQAAAASTTTISVTSGGNVVSGVSSGAVVVLTATVNSGANPVATGTVNFCDATAGYCSDIHLLGMAQLTGSGTATIELRPALGLHSYKAVFVGTKSYMGSSSDSATLTVTGTLPQLATTSTIAETGSWGSYALMGTVTEIGNTVAPTGTVSFLDSNHANAVLGTGSLGIATAGVGSLTKSSPWQSNAISGVTADLNGDGIPDVVEFNGQINVLLGNGDSTFSQAGTIALQSSGAGAIAVGDFNNDDVPDLVAISQFTSTATILLGKGDGTFTTLVTQPSVGNQASGINISDFNGDGDLDLAITIQNAAGNGTLTILLGNGDGTFAQGPQTPLAGNGTHALVSADFNGDGKVDLAITTQVTNSLSILLGNGDGTFTAAASPQVTSYANALAAADFNQDGKLDLIVACQNGGLIVVLIGNGDGTFTAAPKFPVTVSNSVAVVAGDFNLDGIVDAGMLNSDYSVGGPLEFLGKGDGTFTQVPGLPMFGVYTGFMVGGDFNSDGRTDLAISGSGPGNGNMVAYLTEPTETASATANVVIAGVGQHLAAAAYSGDGNFISSTSATTPLWGTPPATTIALAITAAGAPVSSVKPGTLVTLSATVAAGASPITTGQVAFCDASALSCSDIHLFGTVSLSSNGTAALRMIPGTGSHSYKAVFLENGYGMGSSSAAVSLTVGPAPPIVYSDTTTLNYGGSPGQYSLSATVTGFGGLAAPSGSASFVDTSFGNTTLGAATLGSSVPGVGWILSQPPAIAGNPYAEVSGDFNQDGVPDLAFLWATSTYGGPYSVTVLLGKGDGTFTTGATIAIGQTSQIDPYMITGDFNSDGKIDLAVLTWDFSADINYVTTLLSNGDGTFAAPKTNVAFAQPLIGGDGVNGSLTAADFNGDGKLDVAVVGDYIAPGGISILLGKGDGTFNAGTNILPTKDFGLVAAGDFNGDGIPDLIATNYFEYGQPQTVLLGKGDGTFTPTLTSFILDYFPTSVVVGDFNGDGILDLAFSDLNGVEIVIGNGDGTFKETSASPITVPSELYNLQAGDFNHDGKMDLAGLDNYNDRIVLLQGAGDGTFAVTSTIPAVSPVWLGPFAIVANDFNEDGVPDLAMLTKNTATATVLLTEPTETATATIGPVAPVGAGTHNVEAVYGGNGNYPVSTSPAATLIAGVAPVSISPASGTYTTAQTVTITESVPGATIYYSAFGALNTNGFIPYTGPITLAQGGPVTIRAYASETDYQTSNTATVTYQLDYPQSAAPTISPAGGYYANAQTVTITDADPSAKIFYTANGAYPSSSSSLYSGPITVSSSETLVAVALSFGNSLSQPVSAQFVIGSASVPLIYSIAGTGVPGYMGDGGPATFAQIDGPLAIVRDGSGNLYFSDELNHTVRKVAAGTGIITVVAGNGYFGSSGDGGPGTSATLGNPGALALDGSILYISDLGNYTIRRLDLTTGIITAFAGNGSCTISGDGGLATAAGICYATGLAVDSAHNLDISESTAGSIRQVNADTGIISTIAGSSYGYGGDGGPASSALFRSPWGLAFDTSGNLYISDFGNQLIRKITATNGVIAPSSIVSTVAGTPPTQNVFPTGGYSGDGGPATSAKLNGPISVAFDSAGNLYIADENNSVIRRIAASNATITTIAGNALACGPLGDGGAATSASLCYPTSIAADSSGDLFIADSINRIREVTQAAAPPSAQAAIPSFSLQAGSYTTPQNLTITDTTPGASIYVTVDGTPIQGNVNASGYSLPIPLSGAVTVNAIAIAPGYLSSTQSTATYKLNAFTPLITTAAGNGIIGRSTTGLAGLDLSFQQATGLNVDKFGNMYVADTNGCQIWMISASTGIASIYAGTGTCSYTGDGGLAINATLSHPGGLAFDSLGNLYVADTLNAVIRKITADTGVISTVAGHYPPTGRSTGDGGPATSATLYGPSAVAFDAANNLYIADSSNCRIREVSATTGTINTVVGNGTCVASGDGGLATGAGTQPPTSIAVDGAQNICFGTASGRIRKVTAATGQISTIAGVKDQPGDTGNDGPANAAAVNPRALAFDKNGNLYISNSAGEIRKIDSTTGIISRVAGIGFPGFSGDGGAATAAQISFPNQIAFDPTGNLYVVASNRVRKVILVAQATSTPVISPSAGTYSAAQTVTISDSTPGASIFYTNDGSTPTTSSIQYAGPITVSTSETIRALAVALGYTNSDIASATYAINIPTNQVPVLSSLSPAYISSGGTAFALSVNGAGFISASTIYWGSTALTTTYVSAGQLTAQIPASYIASPGTSAITVKTPAPGGGTSNTLQFQVDSSGTGTGPTFSPGTATVTHGSSATYSVLLPSSATNVSASCLNLPIGATCSYSSSSGTLTIATSSTTPPGTYQMIVVFTETLPGAAGALLLPLFLLRFSGARKQRPRSGNWLALVLITLAISIASGCGGGGGSSAGGGPTTQTNTVTSSGVVTLIVQ